MRKSILAVLVAAVFAGCEEKDDGSADFEKGMAAYAARDLRAAALGFSTAAGTATFRQSSIGEQV